MSVMKTSNKSLLATGGIVLALAFSLAGCTAATPSGPAPAGAVGTWGVEAEGEPQLVLAEDGTLSGTDGCNRLTGSWTAEGQTIDFGQVASTMMFCEGVDTWLLDLDTATVSGSTLTVLNADGVEIGSLQRG